jgi:hypothetical protein
MQKTLLALPGVRMSLPDPKFRDELLFHPDDFRSVPDWFKAWASSNGVEVRPSVFMQRYYIIGTGKGADILRGFEIERFHADIEKAMDENAAFLTLLKKNNLI